MSTRSCICSMIFLVGCASPVTDPLATTSLSHADRVATWLDAQARATQDGVEWPVDLMVDPPRSTMDLYHGAGGIILFYLEHYHATGRERSLELARTGAAEIRARLSAGFEGQQMGLYTGIAGTAYVFAELYRTTGDADDKIMALTCLRQLILTARQAGDERGWNNSTDIISGSAGIGLALIRLADELESSAALNSATRAGDRLIALAERDGDRMSWAASVGDPRKMPNFSHGTAGVAYFLARLHQATGEERFLAAARAGAEQLLALAGSDGLVYHDTDNLELDYLSWCHGPPGTAHLFAALDEITGEARYRAWIDQVAATLAASPIPAEKTPGFWNNHGQCCGTAGVADFFMRVGDAGEPVHAARLDSLVNALAAAGEEGPDGLFWTGAEHRVRPELLSTQTGYTQGAAGIGLLFLHDYARRRGAPRRIVLPDQG